MEAICTHAQEIHWPPAFGLPCQAILSGGATGKIIVVDHFPALRMTWAGFSGFFHRLMLCGVVATEVGRPGWKPSEDASPVLATVVQITPSPLGKIFPR